MIMSNKTYDVLKNVSVALPIIGTFYAAVAEIWGLPYGMEIVGTLTAAEALLVGLLKISSSAYAKANQP